MTAVTIGTRHRHRVGAGRRTVEGGIGVVRGQIGSRIPRVGLRTVGHQRGRAGSTNIRAVHRDRRQRMGVDGHCVGLCPTTLTVSNLHFIGARHRGDIGGRTRRRDRCRAQRPFVCISVTAFQRASIGSGRQDSTLLTIGTDGGIIGSQGHRRHRVGRHRGTGTALTTVGIRHRHRIGTGSIHFNLICGGIVIPFILTISTRSCQGRGLLALADAQVS